MQTQTERGERPKNRTGLECKVPEPFGVIQPALEPDHTPMPMLLPFRIDEAEGKLIGVVWLLEVKTQSVIGELKLPESFAGHPTIPALFEQPNHQIPEQIVRLVAQVSRLSDNCGRFYVPRRDN